MKHLLFCYGTLKKGHTRQKYLADQRYLGVGVLKPNHRMVYLGGYPALVPVKEGEEGNAIHGELYEVNENSLNECDGVEGVRQNLFCRTTLQLQSHTTAYLPTDSKVFDLLQKGEVEAYVYCREVGQSRDCGCFWF
mgnify:CR=1 FL=1